MFCRSTFSGIIHGLLLYQGNTTFSNENLFENEKLLFDGKSAVVFFITWSNSRLTFLLYWNSSKDFFLLIWNNPKIFSGHGNKLFINVLFFYHSLYFILTLEVSKFVVLLLFVKNIFIQYVNLTTLFGQLNKIVATVLWQLNKIVETRNLRSMSGTKKFLKQKLLFYFKNKRI